MNGKLATVSSRQYLDVMLYGSAVLAILVAGVALLLSGARAYPELLGLGLLSYTLGLRHAFDADHISAVDNMVRKLVQQRRNPRGVGFFFSCGHSTVVIVMGLITIFAVKWAEGRFPGLRESGGIAASIIAGVFLLIIAFVNFIILRDIIKTFRRLKRGGSAENQEHPSVSGLIDRAISFLFKLVNKDWHVFVVGLLFGLGFDTATQIAVLATSASAASQAVPLLAILSFPVLFTAGMTMMDTLDGFFMCTAYQWVLYSPLRKLYYNLTVTGLSVLAAGVIGVIKITQVITQQIGIESGFWRWLQDLDFNTMGYILVAMFVLVWAVSLMGWRLLRLGDKESGVA